jgi:hypothetical protein
VTDAVELILSQPVKCVIKVRKLRLRRKATAAVGIESVSGGPAFCLVIHLLVTPSRVAFKGGLLTTKTNQVVLSEDDAARVLALPSLDHAMSDLHAVAAGR